MTEFEPSHDNVTLPIRQYIDLLHKHHKSKSKDPSSYIRTIVLKALSDSSVFLGFSELRLHPVVVATLENSTMGKALLNTLDLFSYGTYNDYITASMDTDRNHLDGCCSSTITSSSPYYSKLTDAQLYKLKVLTVITTIHDHCKGLHNNINSSNSKVDQGSTNLQSLTSSSPYCRRMRRKYEHRQLQHLKSTSKKVQQSTVNYSSSIVPYNIIMEQIGLAVRDDNNTDNNNIHNRFTTSERQLEDLLIYCICNNLIPSGSRLDQNTKCLNVKLSTSMTTTALPNDYVLIRDVKRETDLPEIIEQLEDFYVGGLQFKSNLLKSIDALKSNSVNESLLWKEVELDKKAALKDDLAMQESASTSGNPFANSPDVVKWSKAVAYSDSRQVKRSRAAAAAAAASGAAKNNYGDYGMKQGFLKFG